MKLIIMKIDKIHKFILSVFNGTGSLWIFLLMGVIVIDVTGRVFFSNPLKGTPEIVSNSIIAITFLQIPYVMLRKQHVRSTIIYDKLDKKVKNIFDIVISIIGIVLFSLLIISSWEHFVTAVKIGEFEGEGALRVPTSPARFILILGSFLMIIEYIFSILRITFKLDGSESYEEVKS